MLKHDIPLDLVLNLDQTPLSYVSPGKYTFYLKGSSTVTIKGVDDNRQITVTFTVSATDAFLPIQLKVQLKGTYPNTSFQKSYIYEEPVFESRKDCRFI